MGKHLPVYETEPGHPKFSASATVEHLKRSVAMHSTPQGLLVYWNQPKNQKRRQLLNPQQYREVEDAFQFQLDVLNNVGG